MRPRLRPSAALVVQLSSLCFAWLTVLQLVKLIGDLCEERHANERDPASGREHKCGVGFDGATDFPPNDRFGADFVALHSFTFC